LAAAASTHGLPAEGHAVTRDSTYSGADKVPQIGSPSMEAPVGAFKSRLHRQLDTLVGKRILGSLKVLGGQKNRLEGGTRSMLLVLDCFSLSSALLVLVKLCDYNFLAITDGY
jgi:hypothetical protein